MSLSQDLVDMGSPGMLASVVCNDEAIYDGEIISESVNGLWLSVGANPDRVILFPWTSVNRVVLKKF